MEKIAYMEQVGQQCAYENIPQRIQNAAKKVQIHIDESKNRLKSAGFYKPNHSSTVMRLHHGKITVRTQN